MAPGGMPGRPQSGEREPPVVSRRIAAEAAAWIARLHGPNRPPEMEREFREWIARSPAHGYAFERCTDVWTDVASLQPEQIAAGMAGVEARAALARERWWRRMRWPLGPLLVLLIVVGSYVLHWWLAADVYATEVGGQQQVLLADGTRMALNTDTRVRVALSSHRRAVSIDAGEVMFEVASDPLRPFVVRAGGSEVIAVGTIFSVRMPGRSSVAADATLAVTLVEGKVVVQPASLRPSRAGAPESRVTLHPGERMRLAQPAGDSPAPAVPLVDRPSMEPLLAWKQGKAIFDNAPLREAVNEMNRYTRQPVVLLGDATELRVSGTYELGNAEGFAQAVSVLHGLQLRQHEGRLELVRPQ